MCTGTCSFSWVPIIPMVLIPYCSCEDFLAHGDSHTQKKSLRARVAPLPLCSFALSSATTSCSSSSSDFPAAFALIFSSSRRASTDFFCRAFFASSPSSLESAAATGATVDISGALPPPLLNRFLARRLKCFSHSSGKRCEKTVVFFSMFMSFMAPVWGRRAYIQRKIAQSETVLWRRIRGRIRGTRSLLAAWIQIRKKYLWIRNTGQNSEVSVAAPDRHYVRSGYDLPNTYIIYIFKCKYKKK